jgi:hypothetical protein
MNHAYYVWQADSGQTHQKLQMVAFLGKFIISLGNIWLTGIWILGVNIERWIQIAQHECFPEASEFS